MNGPGVESHQWIEVSDYNQVVPRISGERERPKVPAKELLILPRPILAVQNFNNRKNPGLKKFSVGSPG
jgi:hypothetical protein